MPSARRGFARPASALLFPGDKTRANPYYGFGRVRSAVGFSEVPLRAVVKNMFRFEPFIRSWQGVSLFEVRSPNIS